MFASLSPGSSGNGPDRYLASIPFVLAPGSELQLTKEATRHIAGGVRINLEKLQLRYCASHGPFTDEAQAEAGMQRLSAALLWAALELNIGLQYPTERGFVQLCEVPIPIPDTEPMAYIGRTAGWEAIDGFFDADCPVVKPEHKRLVRFEGGRATITAGLAPESFMDKLTEALAFPNLLDIAANDKLRLAIEIFTGHRFEISDQTRFIALVTALEALTPAVSIPPAAMAVHAQAHSAMVQARDASGPGTPEREAINRLLSRLGMLKKESIGSSMNQFAATIAAQHPELGFYDEIREALRQAYEVRSRLLHDGKVDPTVLSVRLQFLGMFVPRLLRALFIQASGRL